MRGAGKDKQDLIHELHESLKKQVGENILQNMISKSQSEYQRKQTEKSVDLNKVKSELQNEDALKLEDGSAVSEHG